MYVPLFSQVSNCSIFFLWLIMCSHIYMIVYMYISYLFGRFSKHQFATYFGFPIGNAMEILHLAWPWLMYPKTTSREDSSVEAASCSRRCGVVPVGFLVGCNLICDNCCASNTGNLGHEHIRTVMQRKKNLCSS